MSMSRDHQRLLKVLCAKPETMKLTEKFLPIAQAKTGPGSGRDLGAGTFALPAICAYIASSQLRNGDVRESVAHTCACTELRLFRRAVATVRSILQDSEEEERRRTRTEAYEELIRSFKIAMATRLTAWMMEIEDELLKHNNFDAGSPPVTCSVFFWLCKRVQVPRDNLQSVFEEYEVPQKLTDKILKALDKTCDSLGSRIAAEVVVLRKEKRRNKASSSKTAQSSSSPTKAPSTPILRRVDSSPSKTPSRKRKLMFVEPQPGDTDEDEMLLLPESPSKKRRADISNATSASSGDEIFAELTMPSTSNTPFRATASTSYLQHQAPVDRTDEAMDVDDAVPKARFRPVFLDQRQWHQRDPRIEQEWKKAEEYKQSMVERYGHPFAMYRGEPEMQ